MSSTCSACNRKTTDKDRLCCFGGCGQSIHFQCSGLTASGITALKENSSLKFACMACRKNQTSTNEVLTKCSNLMASLPALHAKIDNLEQSILTALSHQLSTELKRFFESTGVVLPPSNLKSTFAEILQHNSRNETTTIPPNEIPRDPLARGLLRSGRQRQLNVPTLNTPVANTNTTRSNTSALNTPRNKPARLTKIEQTVIIKPKLSQDADITRNEIQDMLNPVELEVRDARSLPSGDLAIRCASASAAQKLLNAVKSSLSSKYEPEMQKALKPRLKISGFACDIDSDSFLDLLKKQNDFPADSTVKIIRTAKNPNQNKLMFAIIESDAQLFDLLLKRGKVNIGWSRCRVTEQIDVRRCFRCSEYGHIADTCIKPVCCPKCAEGHEPTECTSNFEKCINCTIANSSNRFKDAFLDVAHTAWSANCPIYQKRLKTTKQRTDYAS